MSSMLGFDSRTETNKLAALLSAANAISNCNDCDNAGRVLTTELSSVVSFDFLHLVVFDSNTNDLCWQVLHANGKTQKVPVNEIPTLDSPITWVHTNQRHLVTADWKRENDFRRYGEFLAGLNIVSTCTLPLMRGKRRLGVLSFGSSQVHGYPEDDVRFLFLVADQIALAVDAAINLFLSQQTQDRLRLILDLTNQVVSNLDLETLLHTVSSNIRQVMRCDAAAIMLPDSERTTLRVHALDFPDKKEFFGVTGSIPIEKTLPGEAFSTGKPIVIHRLDPATMTPEMYKKASAMGMNSFCDVPLVCRGRVLGVMAVAKKEEYGFDSEEIGFLSQVANQVAIAIENALAYGEIAELKNKLTQEKLYLEDEIRGEMDFEGIVGQSSVLRHVLSLVETVAPSDSTVLLLGETGTGKERIARAVHDRSRRKNRTFVKLNCAAIPTGLLESELFGHERGAFTGAISQKTGRMELADGGTLFLDEVGDIPLEIQPKLLRALQEREFERLGSTQTKKVDVRLIAATNRDLEKMIENREFRSDLFYRLNVFPIRIPPLRERPEDIPLLVRYFTEKYGRRMEKRIESVPAAAIKKLSSWHWPGNIRELENFIERSVILTHGSVLQVPTAELMNNNAVATPISLPDKSVSERDEILRVLKETNGRVAGPDGAAARMSLKRTTLISRMKKLRIDPRRSL